MTIDKSPGPQIIMFTLRAELKDPHRYYVMHHRSLYNVPGVMGCGQKRFKFVWRCHQLRSGFLAKGNMPRVSRRSLMIKVIMK